MSSRMITRIQRVGGLARVRAIVRAGVSGIEAGLVVHVVKSERAARESGTKAKLLVMNRESVSGGAIVQIPRCGKADGQEMKAVKATEKEQEKEKGVK